jgi:Transposase and inactivated derivatives, IS5 family
LHTIDKNGAPLIRLNETANWEMFRPALEKARDKGRQSTVGPKGYDGILLFKILILQSLYNLSDDATEFQILDRHSFGRFLGLHISQKVPDATTIWRFREDLVKAGIVSVPKQRNSREENARIKEGDVPDWAENKRRRKDVDARWTKKNGTSFFYGYKNHVSIDVKHKMVRSYAVTDVTLHDSKVFEQLLTDNTSKDVRTDSAYRSADRLERLTKDGFREHIQRQESRCHPLTPREQEGNRTRSGIRSRIEHIFGAQAQRAGEVCPESGNRVKRGYLAQSEAARGCKIDRINCQKNMIFVKKMADKGCQGILN